MVIQFPTHQVWFPKTLGHSKQFVRRCPTDDKVLCEINASNYVCRSDKGLICALSYPSDDRFDEIRSESGLEEREIENTIE
jgi:hypothetical protein